MDGDLREAYIQLLKSSTGLQAEVIRQFGQVLPDRPGAGHDAGFDAMKRLARLVQAINADWVGLLQQSVEQGGHEAGRNERVGVA